MKKLKLKFLKINEVRQRFTETLSNLAIDQEEIIVTKNGAPFARITPLYKEEREALREEYNDSKMHK